MIGNEEISFLNGYVNPAQHAQPWSEPEFFKLNSNEDQVRLENLLQAGAVSSIHDPLLVIAQALCEYENPNTKGRPDQQADYAAEAARQGEAYGTWVWFPWSGVLSRFPDRDDYRNLRTSRNRDLITTSEQTRLFDATIAVLGLSVGSKALAALVEGGIGGAYIIGDPDYLDPTNLNRIDAPYTDVGAAKVDIAAKRISERDPWLKQTLLREGINASNVAILGDANLIVEEVDDLSTKAMIRLQAQKDGTPLIMAADVGHTSLVDIERYDLRDRRSIVFLGRISAKDTERISATRLSGAENSSLMLKHTGAKHLSTRLIRSAMVVGDQLGGLPQLGSTASEGGAAVSFAAREILLDSPMATGRYVINQRKTFRLPRLEVPVGEGLRTIVALAKFARKLK